MLFRYISGRVKELDGKKQELMKRISELKLHREADYTEISNYLTMWEELSFDDKRQTADYLIRVIYATSNSIKIEWRMPVDYSAIMLEVQRSLIDFYAHHAFPSGNNKSTQFENAVVEISKEVFATYDRDNGFPQDYHTVEYLGGNIFPDIIIHIGAIGQKVGVEDNREKILIAQVLVLFLEIFFRNPQKRYNNFSVWLFVNNVICKNVQQPVVKIKSAE